MSAASRGFSGAIDAGKRVEEVMHRAILAATMAALTAGMAFAADLPRGPVPYYSTTAAPAGYRWAGWYAGLNIGYEWADVRNSAAHPRGIAGGAQAGYNWQFGQFVLGGETDLQFTGANDTFAPWKFSNPWFGTLRARVGYAMNNILFFGTGGLAYGDVKAENLGANETHTMLGWAAGAGMEVGLTPNWSAKAEYLYMDLGNHTYTLTGNDLGLRASILRLGVNYHF
jgi:outer membrane immunogenic protein